MRGHRLGDPKFVAGMRPDGVTFGQLYGDLFGKITIEAALDIDPCKLFQLRFGRFRQFTHFPREVRLFGIGLRTDRDILARCHGHRACHEPGKAGYQDFGLSRTGRGNAPRGLTSDDPVTGAQSAARSQSIRRAIWISACGGGS